ncbi:MAG: YscO family type III secretion system apparatus protein [Pseudomonadota bacterium]
MIEKFKTLCHVKSLREDRMFRELQTARSKLADAEREVVRQTEIVEESKRTLPTREEKIFQKIMQKVVDVEEIDQTKADVVKLQEDHQRLVDNLERAKHVKKEREKAVEAALREYRKAQRNHEKFVNMKTDLETERDTVLEQREEGEIEELFSKGQAVM